MFVENGSLWSSFEHSIAIQPDQGVVTALSGSQGNGGHAALFMEYISSLGTARTIKLDLSASGKTVIINVVEVQTVNGQPPHLQVLDIHDGLPKEREALALTNHRSYLATLQQCLRLGAAAQRFAVKAQNGRYVYFKPGGALGWTLSLPGHRGVNCADFVIKLLNEAGIAHRHHLLFDTPKRIARRRHD